MSTVKKKRSPKIITIIVLNSMQWGGGLQKTEAGAF